MDYAQDADREDILEALAKRGVKTRKGTEVDAYINHGRWVADCPNCNGAELVAPGVTMICGSCGAEHIVKLPRNRKKIEEVLEVRGEKRLMNWSPGETPADLVAENIDHGIYPDDMKVT